LSSKLAESYAALMFFSIDTNFNSRFKVRTFKIAIAQLKTLSTTTSFLYNQMISDDILQLF